MSKLFLMLDGHNAASEHQTAVDHDPRERLLTLISVLFGPNSRNRQYDSGKQSALTSLYNNELQAAGKRSTGSFVVGS